VGEVPGCEQEGGLVDLGDRRADSELSSAYILKSL
jgi:hypothetical protein